MDNDSEYDDFCEYADMGERADIDLEYDVYAELLEEELGFEEG